MSQLLYLPYNIFCWCILKEFIPRNTVLFFLEKNALERPIQEVKQLRFLLDIDKDEQSQMLELLFMVASYNCLKEGRPEKDIVALVSEYTAMWDVESTKTSNVAFDFSDALVIHPVIVFLQLMSLHDLLEEYELIVLGQVKNVESSGLLYIEDERWQDNCNYLLNISSNTKVLKKEYLKEWDRLQIKNSDLLFCELGNIFK